MSSNREIHGHAGITLLTTLLNGSALPSSLFHQNLGGWIANLRGGARLEHVQRGRDSVEAPPVYGSMGIPLHDLGAPSSLRSKESSTI